MSIEVEFGAVETTPAALPPTVARQGARRRCRSWRVRNWTVCRCRQEHGHALEHLGFLPLWHEVWESSAISLWFGRLAKAGSAAWPAR